MELLSIKHNDFEMIIECGKFDDIWRKAAGNVGEQNLLSTYSWTKGVVSVTKHTEHGDVLINKGTEASAIFFDNCDYPIWIEFNKKVQDAQFASGLQSDNERFTLRHNILAGIHQLR